MYVWYSLEVGLQGLDGAGGGCGRTLRVGKHNEPWNGGALMARSRRIPW